MNDFRKLEIWERARKLCVPIYALTAQFPKSEIYGLTSQIRRSCVSISSNIAEGSGRKGNREYAQMISIALGSAYELETQLEISFELNFISQEEYITIKKEIVEVQKMIYSFREYLLKKI